MTKSLIVAAAALAALTTVAEAKGGKQVFNAPGDYDYSREKKPGYKPDYCADSVGNHVYCRAGNARPAAPDDAYMSSYKVPK